MNDRAIQNLNKLAAAAMALVDEKYDLAVQNADLTAENKALRSALTEMAATALELADHVTTLSGTGVGSYVFDDIASDIKEIADFAAQALLNGEGKNRNGHA